MGIRERYARGIFNWVDLMTIDPKAAEQFYGKLFGWEFDHRPMPNGESYGVAQKNGRDVTAIFAQPEDQKAQGIPPHWQSYINTPDLDETVVTWEAKGGKVFMPPCEVMSAGRMAVVQDPTGAVVNLWQAQEHIGAGVVNEVNTYCWAELQTWDANAAIEFYQEIFGWEIEVDEKPPHYVMGKVDGHLKCGFFDMSKTELPRTIPATWATYFNVANLDTAIAKVTELGGSPLMEPIVLDVGRFTTIQDPQGAMVTLIELSEVDD